MAQPQRNARCFSRSCFYWMPNLSVSTRRHECRRSRLRVRATGKALARGADTRVCSVETRLDELEFRTRWKLSDIGLSARRVETRHDKSLRERQRASALDSCGAGPRPNVTYFWWGRRPVCARLPAALFGSCWIIEEPGGAGQGRLTPAIHE